MKKIVVIFILIFCLFPIFGCTQNNSESVVRIHIRANSNNVCDQEVKLKVRDNIIDYITPLIAECENSKEVKMILEKHLNDMENIADETLIKNGFEYMSKANIRNEYFPTRNYNGKVFEADYYDALIIELGSGKGDNWWCVAYPPLCFVGENFNDGNVRYKSKLVELINKYFGDN